MIIFYNKKTGKVVGTIEGRIHTEDHLRMWIGDRKDTDRIICNWIKVGEDKENYIFEPEHEQKEIFAILDRKEKKVREYKVNLKTKRLELKK